MPTHVDLRSNYERTYSQGYDNACGPYALCNALDCIYERSTGQPTRFDPYPLWDAVREFRGVPGTNTGSTFESLERAVRATGMRLGNETVNGLTLMRTSISDRSYSEIRHLLCMGVPVVLEIKVTPEMDALADKRDWRKHVISPDCSTYRGQHYVTFMGFDDSVQRWLTENSWGGDWADGGFFGVPYASLPSLAESFQHFNQLPIVSKPVEGYTVPVAYLLTSERAAFTERAAPMLKQLLADALAAGGAQGVIDTCIAWGISEKHIEALHGWPVNTVRSYKQENAGLNWDGFHWDQL